MLSSFRLFNNKFVFFNFNLKPMLLIADNVLFKVLAISLLKLSGYNSINFFTSFVVHINLFCF